jgi:hypothetical protein
MRHYVYVTERYEETLAAYERLGFERIRAWDRGGDLRSALFRAGPSYVEVLEGAARPDADSARRAPARARPGFPPAARERADARRDAEPVAAAS